MPTFLLIAAGFRVAVLDERDIHRRNFKLDIAARSARVALVAGGVLGFHLRGAEVRRLLHLLHQFDGLVARAGGHHHVQHELVFAVELRLH